MQKAVRQFRQLFTKAIALITSASRHPHPLSAIGTVTLLPAPPG